LWLYDYADFARANHLISRTNWDVLLNSDVSKSVVHWEEKFLEIMHVCIQTRQLRKRYKPPLVIRRSSPTYKKAKDFSTSQAYKSTLRQRTVLQVKK
jgi:hypothetical protein